jgi:hypothetical protein
MDISLQHHELWQIFGNHLIPSISKIVMCYVEQNIWEYPNLFCGGSQAFNRCHGWSVFETSSWSEKIISHFLWNENELYLAFARGVPICINVAKENQNEIRFYLEKYCPSFIPRLDILFKKDLQNQRCF